LHALGLNNQRLAINGVFHAGDHTDSVVRSRRDNRQSRDGWRRYWRS
jgi:hypothetical protein